MKLALPNALRPLVCLLGMILCAADVRAAKEIWTDLKGNTFKAEPSEVVGPFAIFKVDSQRSRRVPLDLLSPEDCVRFQKGLASTAPRASSWAEATGELTRELASDGCRVGDKLVQDAFATKPEPQFIVVVFGSSGAGDSWKILGDVGRTLTQLMKDYPGMIDGYFYGFGHNAGDQRNMTKSMGWPGLLQDIADQSRSSIAGEFSVGQPGALLLTRRGMPLISLSSAGADDVDLFCRGLREEMALTIPSNPKTWSAKLHYQRAVRKALHAANSDGPLLIGNPLRVNGLAQRKVVRIHATLHVEANGSVSSASIEPDSIMPEEFKQPLAEALKKGALFAPAVSKGQEVAASYDFALDVDQAEHKVQMKDLAGALDVQVPEWLVLRPIKVEKVFDPSAWGVKQVLDDGSVIMKSVYVGAEKSGAPSFKVQSQAFMTDWFQDDEGGAASVQPSEGMKTTVMGAEYTWKVMKPNINGMLDFQDNGFGRNWVIAYAYAEIQSPKDGVGYLCMGSDDACRVWVNGRKVHETWANRPVNPDDDIVPVKLVKGTNRVLVKVQNFLMPGWGMAFHVMIP